MNLSSPNRIVWQYFEALRRLVNRLGHATDVTALKQDVAVCIMLAVTVVEAFLNIFFRVVVSEPGFAQHKQRILEDLERRKSLDYKLKHWPRQVFGSGLDFAAPVPSSFLALKDRRNALMHFTSNHQTLALRPGINIEGLADTSAFDTLTVDDAADALDLAEGMVGELFRLRGTPDNQLPHALHLWTGKAPI
ncbi:hypothetical protein KAW44_04975 [Candidatus Bipolaricaulota bacterium]|nr:hypothetical protein [Candidatus Bipolaricaulota bacterium]